MRWKGLGLGLFLVAFSAVVGTAKAPEVSDMIVHEWGTFLAMQGSDGVTLDGMYHEEHALPSFVHARSREELRLPTVSVKGETPVIYFYTNRAQSVNVTVGFPQGIWTQWYPQAGQNGPRLAATGAPDVRGGHITWHAEVLPNPTPAPALPAASSDALWNFARDVDAAYVRTKNGSEKHEYERFLFYRGLGRADLPLEMTAAEGGTLTWTGIPAGARHLFILRVENGVGKFRYVPSLSPGTPLTGVIPVMKCATRLPEFIREVSDALAARLTECGLYPKEARAMVNTWKSSYFQTEGIRVLYVLPQAWTDRFIPMRLDPQPRELVRVMVGRLELLTPEREKQAENAVRDLRSPDAARREVAFKYLQDQGRYVEPILRRVVQTTEDEAVRKLCKRLLLTGWVTEIRAAAQTGPGRHPVRDNSVHMRAQLASLLREAGLEKEAKAEAEPVLAALQKMPAPKLDDHMARFYLRTYARTLEALGDERGAASAYAEFVRFGSGIKKCGGCHHEEGPKNMAWFRDWWAGKKVGEYFARTGQADPAITRYETALRSDPFDVSAQMMLAYLYAAKGQKEKAQRMWARLAPESGPQVAAGGSARSR
jgi:tetratricopeptide (TPR) repeat protein